MYSVSDPHGVKNFGYPHQISKGTLRGFKALLSLAKKLACCSTNTNQLVLIFSLIINFKNLVMYEIKILRGEDASVQKTLNQWKHKFSVKILSCVPCPHKEGVTHATVCRTAKPE